MPENLAVIGVILATGCLVLTVLFYERYVRELRYQIALKDEHLRQCQGLIATMRRHPAKGVDVSANLRLVHMSDTDAAS
jgi:hypothetical protein